MYIYTKSINQKKGSKKTRTIKTYTRQLQQVFLRQELQNFSILLNMFYEHQTLRFHYTQTMNVTQTHIIHT